MSKRIIRYEDVEKIVSGKNTVVYGQQCLRYSQVLEEAYRAVNAAFEGVYEKGVAKCAPSDEYDEVKGKEIASKRAEKAGNRELKLKLVKAVCAYERVLAYLNSAIDDLDGKFAELKKELGPSTETGDKEQDELFVDMHPDATSNLDAILSGAEPIGEKVGE